MTEAQIQYMCDIGYGNRVRQEMLDAGIKEKGLGQFLIIKEDGTFSGIPRSILYDTCIAMVKDRCFYIDREDGLLNLTLPFQNKERDKVTKEEKTAALAYAKNHGIKMPENFRCLFYEWHDIVIYVLSFRDIFPEGKEKRYFASALTDSINAHWDVFLQGGWISEKDLCDEVIYRYNKRTLSSMAFSENIKNYPKNSPVYKLVARAFSLVWSTEHSRPQELWVKENATPSMDKKDFPLFKAIASIKKPLYEKSPGNKKPGTFDTIRVWFSLVSTDFMPDRNAFIKKNRKGFARLALACIRDDCRCRVPVNLLKIDHIGITSQSQLEFIFSLKDKVETILKN